MRLAFPPKIVSTTCLKFKPRSSEYNYIYIATGNGCSSYVGMIGGSQKVSLDNGCVYVS
jgi:hypothetical protein